MSKWSKNPVSPWLPNILVRRVFPSLIASDIVSVQPMTAPSSAIFDIDYFCGIDDIFKIDNYLCKDDK